MIGMKGRFDKGKMKILFITSTRIGDAVLSTGLLSHILQTYKRSEITLVCGPLPSSLFKGLPNLDKLIVLKKEKRHGHWFKLWKQVIGTRWDIVIDLRDSIVSRAIFAKKRYIFGSQIDKNKHKVEQFAELMQLRSLPTPKIWYTGKQIDTARTFISEHRKPVIAVGPTANWIGKTWPVENFIQITEWLRSDKGFFPDAHVVVLAAPGEEKNAVELLKTIPQNRRIDVVAKTDPGTAATILSLCDFYIGNDSGLMHSAAAAGIPTVGLFGASWPHLYAPWGENATYVSTPQTFAELTDFEGYDPKTLDHSLMTSLSVEKVKEAVTEFLNK